MRKKLAKYDDRKLPEPVKAFIPDRLRFARAVYRATDKGKVLLEFAMGVLNDENTDMRHRIAAMNFLADRMYGKAKLDIEVTGGANVNINQTYIDLRGLSDEELAVLEKMSLSGAMQPASAQAVLDATVNEPTEDYSEDSDDAGET